MIILVQNHKLQFHKNHHKPKASLTVQAVQFRDLGSLKEKISPIWNYSCLDFVWSRTILIIALSTTIIAQVTRHGRLWDTWQQNATTEGGSPMSTTVVWCVLVQFHTIEHGSCTIFYSKICFVAMEHTPITPISPMGSIFYGWLCLDQNTAGSFLLFCSR